MSKSITNRVWVEKSSPEDLLGRVFDECGVVDQKIVKNAFGKPYLASGELFFNLSDSGEYAVCVVADVEVGVDIQKICMRERVIERSFNDAEKAIAKTAEDFTRIWASKEAYAKMLGGGISVGLKTIDTTALKSIETERFGDYVIAICYNR